jgi:hypothetical protein
MDKVRFGRALGYGARHTAKAIYKAVDAARTPDARAPEPSVMRPASAQRPSQQPVARAMQTQRTVATNAKALGRSVLTPVARFSSVLWLQVTGSVFAVIALALGQAVWLRRADLHTSPHGAAAQRAYLLVGIFLLFLYFAVSSFVRAHRRERR